MIGDWMQRKLQPKESQHVESGSLIRIVQLRPFQKPLKITKEFGRKTEIFCSSWPIVSSDKNAQKALSWQKLKCITQGRRSCNSLECNHRVLFFFLTKPLTCCFMKSMDPRCSCHIDSFHLRGQNAPTVERPCAAMCMMWQTQANWVCESWSLL